MRRFHAIPATLLLCALAAASAFSTPQVRPKYAFTVVPLGAGQGSYATAINGTGQVAGRLIPGSGEHAFLYSNGTLTDLGTLPGKNASVALGINNAQQVVGISFESARAGFGHAFLYSGGTMRDLGSLGGGETAALDINDAGDIVGASGSFAFLYRDGMMQNLCIPPASSGSVALAINNKGQIAGSAFFGSPQEPSGVQSHAVLWANGHVNDLGTLGGLNSYGRAINDHGQVVGYSTLAGSDGLDGDSRGFIWSNGKMRDLGTPPEGKAVQPLGINNRGEIVGVYDRAGQQRAFLYGDRGGMQDLTEVVDPAQGWRITIAYAINDAGQIAGEACDQSFTCTAVRLDPVSNDGRAGDGERRAYAPGR